MDWNELVIDYDRMSAETLLLADQIQEGKISSEISNAPMQMTMLEVIEQNAPEETISTALETHKEHEIIKPITGLLYRLDIQGRTFSIRGITSDSIDQTYMSALQGRADILTALRIEEDVPGQIRCFYTPELPTAEILADQLFNRRFPLHEDSYFNVSDPGPGLWFVDRGPSELCLSFKRIFHQNLSTLSLGPIVDSQVALRRFQELPKCLLNWPSEICLKTDEKAMALRFQVDGGLGHEFLQKLKEICCEGKMVFTRDDFKNTSEGKTAYFFLLELAYTRKFWREIETELGKTTNSRV